MKALIAAAIALALLAPACDDDDPECEKQQKAATGAIAAGMDRDQVEAIFASAAPEDCDFPLE